MVESARRGENLVELMLTGCEEIACTLTEDKMQLLNYCKSVLKVEVQAIELFDEINSTTRQPSYRDSVVGKYVNNAISSFDMPEYLGWRLRNCYKHSEVDWFKVLENSL